MSLSFNSFIRFLGGLSILLCTSRLTPADAASLEIIDLPEKFSVGEQLTLTAVGEDDAGIDIRNRRLRWQVRFHTTPTSYTLLLNTTAGNNIACPPIPEPPHLPALMYGFVRVLLTTRDDNDFLNATVTDIYPKTVDIQFITRPSGKYLQVMGNAMVFGPTTLAAWENQVLKVNAPDQRPYLFANWNDPAGGTDRERIIHVTEKGLKEYSANFFVATADPTPSPSPAPSSLPTLEPIVSFAITRFSLEDASTNKTLVDPIVNGATFSAKEIGKDLTVRAHAKGKVGSVQFDFADIIGYMVENYDPFSLGGNSPYGSGEPYYGSVPELATPGTFTVAATPFSGEKLQGLVGRTAEVTFTIV